MNVFELICLIEHRPGMFVGKPSLESLHLFISGFLFNNLINDNADELDLKFKKYFHDWVKKYIESTHKVSLEPNRNYVDYINYVFPNNEQRIQAFFSLCRIFFNDEI